MRIFIWNRRVFRKTTIPSYVSYKSDRERAKGKTELGTLVVPLHSIKHEAIVEYLHQLVARLDDFGPESERQHNTG
eukprot:1190420-Prorocentrum_minimum.AAC.2